MSEPTIWAKARAELQRRGWYQGAYRSDDNEPDTCAVCLLGALNAAATGDAFNDWWPHSDVFFERLFDHLGDSGGTWNDRNYRTVDAVYALLEALDAEDRKAGVS